MNRIETFNKIKQAYKEHDDNLLRNGRLPMRSTEKGFWGTTNLDDLYAWLERMDFPQRTRFLDLGSGDGRVVLVAALFVDAMGIEDDNKLLEHGRKVAELLELDYPVEQGDYNNQDLTRYDVLFMYPDQRFDALKDKLLRELRGTLYLYHDTYHPYFLVKGPTTWIGQIPFFTYSNHS